jgi:hypothetical protein
MRSALTTFMAVLATTITATLGQAVPPPSEGYQLGGPVNPSDPGGPSFDIIMPLTVTQCDPVLIYYNITAWNAANGGPLDLLLSNPSLTSDFAFVTIQLPSSDIGYLTWTCNIPAGENFYASAVSPVSETLAYATFTVKSGSSSACLGPLTTYTSMLQYDTTVFASYTAASYMNSIILPSPLIPAYVFPSLPLVYSSILLDRLQPFLRALFRPSPSSANFHMVNE